MKFVQFMAAPAGRILRAVAGTAIIVAGIAMQTVPGGFLAAFGAVVLLSGVLNMCLIAPLLRAPFKGKDVRTATASGSNRV